MSYPEPIRVRRSMHTLPMKLLVNTVLAGIVYGIWFYISHVLGYGFGDIPQLM